MADFFLGGGLIKKKRLPKDFPLFAADVLEAASYSLECTVYSVLARNLHVWQVNINIHDESKKKTQQLHSHTYLIFLDLNIHYSLSTQCMFA